MSVRSNLVALTLLAAVLAVQNSSAADEAVGTPLEGYVLTRPAPGAAAGKATKAFEEVLPAGRDESTDEKDEATPSENATTKDAGRHREDGPADEAAVKDAPVLVAPQSNEGSKTSFGVPAKASSASRPISSIAPPPGTVSEVNFTTVEGETKIVRSDKIWRIRKTVAEWEPQGAWIVYHAGGRFFASDKGGDLVRRVSRQVHLTTFTAPNGMPVYLAPDKIDRVLDAVKGKHHMKAKTLIVTRWGSQQVQEAGHAVNRIVELALKPR